MQHDITYIICICALAFIALWYRTELKEEQAHKMTFIKRLGVATDLVNTWRLKSGQPLNVNYMDMEMLIEVASKTDSPRAKDLILQPISPIDKK
jgi:hypothetical protein